MEIKLCAYNLGTLKTAYGTITSLNELYELGEQVNPDGSNDVEYQIMDCEYLLRQDDLFDYLELIEKVDAPWKDVADLLYRLDADDAKTVLENKLPYMYVEATNKENAFYAYYENMGYQMPDPEWIDFIDWGRKLEEFENSGLQIIYLGGSGKHILTSNYLVVQTY